jgi:hypothetical protein
MSEPPITNVPGLVLVASGKAAGSDVDSHSYKFGTDANHETVRAILSCVSERRELTFFDAEHPQFSEPGAYISVIRSTAVTRPAPAGPDGLLAQRSNHGWSGSWIPVTDDEVEQYLFLCIPFHTASTAEHITFTEPSNWGTRRSISRWRWNSFRRYLKKRLAPAV